MARSLSTNFEFAGVYHTGGSVNPARTLGPCVVLHSFYGYHWVRHKLLDGICGDLANNVVDLLDRSRSRIFARNWIL